MEPFGSAYDALPDEIWVHILEIADLSALELAAISQVSRQLANIASLDTLWKKCFIAKWRRNKLDLPHDATYVPTSMRTSTDSANFELSQLRIFGRQY
jgi:hypothetical protein